MSLRVIITLSLFALAITACGEQSQAETSSQSTASEPTTSSEVDVPGDPHMNDENPLTAARDRHDFVWLGLSEADAQAQAEAQGLTWQVVRRDGEDIPEAPKLEAGQIHAHILEGKVLAVLRKSDHGAPPLYEGVSLPELLPFIGLSEAESKAAAEAAGRPWRLISRDGEQFMVTMDYRENRVNTIVRDGVVVAANNG